MRLHAQAQLEEVVQVQRGSSPDVRMAVTCRLLAMQPTGVEAHELQQLPLPDAVGVLRQACPG